MSTRQKNVSLKLGLSVIGKCGEQRILLKVHMKRKHTSYLPENSPIKCDICDDKFKYWDDKPWEKERIDEHRISHSYTSTSEFKFKCEECNFWGPNRLSM